MFQSYVKHVVNKFEYPITTMDVCLGRNYSMFSITL